ncbi:SUKH-4 family immunity protein [Nonomuraea gerenzanensis]|uniref:SUKH-4 family immunity protein n=1 Tax=Nonomuraea gerenzanensis TaxID=93944 RepID=UPI001CD96342|nr:SUKH-4 family immunity protein [Nonomuraea gerenzanensis]UBU12523.1 SUKH-4 family immunity protein [Nonomuraea gerenzanensis]
MNAEEVYPEIGRILAADLGSLTGNGRFSAMPPSSLHAWSLPEPDKAALSAYGLPGPRTDGLYGVTGDFQPSGEPELTQDGARFYRLGGYAGVRHLAEEGTGRVVLPVPTSAEVHPQLAARFPDRRTFKPVNSSVTAWVECAWRWHWLVPLITEQWKQAEEAQLAAWRDAAGGAPDAEFADFHAPYRRLCRQVVVAFELIDPAAVASEESFWTEVISER